MCREHADFRRHALFVRTRRAIRITVNIMGPKGVERLTNIYPGLTIGVLKLRANKEELYLNKMLLKDSKKCYNYKFEDGTKLLSSFVVYVRTIIGREIPVCCNEHDTVCRLKQQYSCLIGHPPDSVRLSFLGRALPDMKTLEECGIRKFATIQHIVELR